MPIKRSHEPQSVDRRRFLGASVSTAALPFLGARLDEAFAWPAALAPGDSRVLVALSVNGDAYQLGPIPRLGISRRLMKPLPPKSTPAIRHRLSITTRSNCSLPNAFGMARS
jgi:hypothetical protein